MTVSHRSTMDTVPSTARTGGPGGAGDGGAVARALRITVVGINYAPEMTGIAPYTTAIAEGLAAFGHTVTVVTGLPHYPEWRIDTAYLDSWRDVQTLNGVTVERVRHYVPEEQSAQGRVQMEASFAARATRHRWNSPDLVLVVSPALLSAASVVTKARMLKVPVGVIVQDIYSKGVVETGALTGRSVKATTLLEARTLRGADGVAVIHNRFADVIADMGVALEKLTVIRNWTHIESLGSELDSAGARARFGWKPEEIVVLHTGNMGVKQGLENVVAAGRLADESNHRERPVRFVLVGDGNQRRMLDSLAADVDSVDLVDPLPADSFRLALCAADVLLVNERPGVGEMAVPSKLTSYFVAGKPIVAATDPESGCAEELRAAGAGIAVPPGEPNALLAAARRLGVDDVLGRELGRSGERYADSVLSAQSAMAQYEKWCQKVARHRR